MSLETHFIPLSAMYTGQLADSPLKVLEFCVVLPLHFWVVFPLHALIPDAETDFKGFVRIADYFVVLLMLFLRRSIARDDQDQRQNRDGNQREAVEALHVCFVLSTKR